MTRLIPSGENSGDDREAVKRWTIHECLMKLGMRELDDLRPVHIAAHPQKPDTFLVEGSYFSSVALPAAVVTVGSPAPVDLSISSEVPEPLKSASMPIHPPPQSIGPFTGRPTVRRHSAQRSPF
ncbi:hypothetical protein [Aeromicrobium sp.]|uniref:hypothetical protein n=1 Tax=Aeromicrobium sp. TaxID=1871063 RepID=UPI001985BE75|nr:hypothetical protein [Aeromicrobium sp.]MBC7631526.1 hypothetical protein [Aeromicrobium sp.]